MATKDTQGKAKLEKNDEFYTLIENIEDEILNHSEYLNQLKNKVIYMNCDDPEKSDFVKFFYKYFHEIGIKKIIVTHYVKAEKIGVNSLFGDLSIALGEKVKSSYRLDWYGDELDGKPINIKKTELKSNGDFRSNECVDILKEADIIVTNPPFSLFKEFVDLMIINNKKFILLGNNNAVSYSNIFKLFIDNKIRLGYSSNASMFFRVPDGYNYHREETNKRNDGNKYSLVFAVSWFTNLALNKDKQQLELTKHYNEIDNPKYDNYNAIEVNKVVDIPCDYYEPMGVPITFMSVYCPEQFELLGLASGRKEFDERAWPTLRYKKPYRHFPDGSTHTGYEANNGPTLKTDDLSKKYYTDENSDHPFKICYARIIIKRKSSEALDNRE